MNRDESNHGVIQGETLSNKARRCNQVDSFGYSDVEKWYYLGGNKQVQLQHTWAKAGWYLLQKNKTKQNGTMES